MKRLLLFLVLLVCAKPSVAQLNVWRWQNPLPVGNYLRAVQMMSLNTIYVCGDGGTFMRSSDAGQSWDVQNVLKIKANFNALSFMDENYGMCCGDSGKVIKTTDGGNSWQILKTNTFGKFNSIVVLDQNIAIIITLGGAIMRTSDGGNTWGTIPIEGNQALFSIRMLRPDFLSITGFGGALLISTDKGLTWPVVPMRNYGNTFFSSNFTDNNNGTLIGEYGLILHTTDGGINWTKQQLADSSIITASLNVVDGRDPNILGIVGDYGTVLFTTNGGASWQQFFIGTTDPVKGLSFFDKMNAIAVGRNGMVLQTTNGGASWVYLPHKALTNVLHSVAFPKGDTSLGLAVGDNGTILRTSDGGKKWALVDSGFPTKLRGVCFSDAVSAIAVGDNGTIIKSTDAGLTWNTLSSSTTQNIYSVSFANPNDGLAVGDFNTILRTYSGGQFWTREFAPVGDTDYFNCVSFPDPNHAFMTGFHGYYVSSNGGVDWKYYAPDLTPLSSYVFHGISFADSLHGSMIHSYGPDGSNIVYWYAKFTSDGGANWNTISTPNNVALNNIQCVDKQHSTVVGNGGYIGHTTDGGATLNVQASNTLNNLYGVCFGTLQAGTTVGNRGNILRILSNDKLGVKQISASGSPKITLDPNYPNPFSLITTINYNLPASGFTTLEIFSTDGKHISTLVHEFQISGDHVAHFDATGIASGTYIVRATCGGLSASREIVVLR